MHHHLPFHSEHLHSTEGYRRENFVPLFFETARASVPKPLKTRGWVLFVEALAFIAGVVVLAIVAVISRGAEDRR
jgi:hypothetical protein